MEENKFTAVIDNVKYDAYVIANFNILGDSYCVFAVDNGKEEKDVYCNKIIDDNLVNIQSEEEKRIVTKVVNSIIEAVKGRDIDE